MDSGFWLVEKPSTDMTTYTVYRSCTNCDNMIEQWVRFGVRKPSEWVCPVCGVKNQGIFSFYDKDIIIPPEVK